MQKPIKAFKQMTLQSDIEIPWDVKRFFKECPAFIDIAADQASFGEDYGTIDEIRKALTWFVDQFGGEVSWDVSTDFDRMIAFAKKIGLETQIFTKKEYILDEAYRAGARKSCVFRHKKDAVSIFTTELFFSKNGNIVGIGNECAGSFRRLRANNGV